MGSTMDTDVLIVGGGPIGLLTALLFANHGFRSIVLEKHRKRLGQPKAHAINPRSLEILKQADLDVAHLRRIGVNSLDGDAVRFASSVAAKELGHLPYERQDDDVKSETPEPLFNIAQPKLELFIELKCRESDLVTIRRPVQWQSCSRDDPDGPIVSTVSDPDSGKTTTIASKYLVGCDGAHSAARAQLQMPFSTLDHQPEVPIHYLSVHLRMDLSHMPSGTLWFILQEQNLGTFICYDRRDEYVFITHYDPRVTPVETFTEEYCRRIVDKALGEPTDYEVRGITWFNMTPKIADNMRAKTIQSAFLVGDAAHCFPATGGLGINTGIADAHNLVWKIRALEDGWTDSPKFLDTYSSDRRPVAIANARQSQLNQQKIHRLAGAVFSHAERSEVERARLITEAIQDNADHFDSLNLQIGYVYGRDDMTRLCSDYRKEFVPGGRLPHEWVKRQGQLSSTLDLVPFDKFMLLATADFPEWPGLEQSNPPVAMLRLGKDFTVENAIWTGLMGLDNMSTAVLVRPDQHIVGAGRTVDDVRGLLDRFLHPENT